MLSNEQAVLIMCVKVHASKKWEWLRDSNRICCVYVPAIDVFTISYAVKAGRLMGKSDGKEREIWALWSWFALARKLPVGPFPRRPCRPR
jgi:hypothetical protein